MKILNTDYRQWALLYFCDELENEATCLPGSETVFVLSRSPPQRDHSVINALVQGVVREECFTKRDFEWIQVDNSGKFLFIKMWYILFW